MVQVVDNKNRGLRKPRFFFFKPKRDIRSSSGFLLEGVSPGPDQKTQVHDDGGPAHGIKETIQLGYE
jgi:hypothetical protein